VYACLFAVFPFGGVAVGDLTDNNGESNSKGIGALITLIVTFGVVYFGIEVRRKIGALPADYLKSYMANTIFLQGIGGLAPIVFLTAESLHCLYKYKEYGVCEGIVAPNRSMANLLVSYSGRITIFGWIVHLTLPPPHKHTLSGVLLDISRCLCAFNDDRA